MTTLTCSQQALEFAKLVLVHGGTFCCKLLQGRDDAELRAAAAESFTSAKFVKPKASRSSSAEVYLLATGYKGRAKAKPV
jgi:23S rRNA (uridine2552-2'-O)-methyltransferase